MSGLGKAIGSIFGGGTSAVVQQVPTPQPVVAQPSYDDPQAQEARRKRLADLQAGKGREGTILTRDVSPNYTNAKLGQ